MDMIRVMRIQFAWGAQLLRNSCYTLFIVHNVDATPWVNVSTLLFCIMIVVCNAHTVVMGRSSDAQHGLHLVAFVHG